MNQDSLKLLALIISIAGIFTLLILVQLIPPIKITSPAQLKEIRDNQKVIIQGKVTDEVNYEKSLALTIDGKIKLQCSNCPFQAYKDKNITAIAQTDQFSDKTYLNVLTIKIK